MNFIDTHTHLDGEEFDADRNLVIERAQEAGVSKVFVPAIDMKSVKTVLDTCQRYPGYAYPMIGLHPEEVRADWSSVLDDMHQMLKPGHPFIAIGEVGLDYYWSREFEHEQLQAFERQVEWSIETRLPLMIHCRKGQNEMVKLLNQYRDQLPGGVFHCFTGNEKEPSAGGTAHSCATRPNCNRDRLALYGTRTNARQAQRERIRETRARTSCLSIRRRR